MSRSWSTYQLAIFDAVSGTKKNLAVNAVAGSGKTTSLVEIYNRLPRNASALFLAFNKHIVNELQSRLKGCDCMTLHSLGFKAIKTAKGKTNLSEYKISDLVDAHFAKNEPTWLPSKFYGAFFGLVRQVVDKARVTLTDISNEAAADEMLAHFGLWGELAAISDESDIGLDLLAQQLIKSANKVLDKSNIAYQKNGIIDFTDMLYIPCKYGLPVVSYDVVLVDEAQDLNAAQLELVMKAAGKFGRVIAVGDKCQPAGTMVTTVKKYGTRWAPESLEDIAIEDLKVGDIVKSYAIQDCHYYRKPINGITARPYSGNMYTVTMPDEKSSRYTPNHLCITSFAKFRNDYCVYIMQKGNQFRIGLSKINMSTNAQTGPVQRMLHEGGDALWILEMHKTRHSAMIREQAIAGKFGLPQLMFNPSHVKVDGMIEQAWEYIGDNTSRGIECLVYFGRNMLHPLFAKDMKSLMPENKTNARSLKRPMVTSASNLMNGCLMLPHTATNNARKSQWLPITVSKSHYDGTVYSLGVEKYHTYVADGIVTHNCQAIMGFSGADSESFDRIIRRTNAVELPLSICYRCPVSILN